MGSRKKARVAFEDGRIFQGYFFGANGTSFGEVVFNTSMAGYQEILTDPSYKGQIVTMTYPLIGNYGINREDVESRKPFLEGFIVKECSRIRSNWRSEKSLEEYLKENNIIGIEGIDTRALTRHIRLQGAMRAVISTQNLDDKVLIEKAKFSPGLIGRDLVKEVTCSQIYKWNYASRDTLHASRFKVVVLDYGVKYNILRELVNLGCQVTVVPAKTTAEQILSMQPDGLFLSNGPGDPAAVPYVVETIKKLIHASRRAYRQAGFTLHASRNIPIMGICLGHQMLGLALGGKTYKLKFGHHGGNHPVKDLNSGKVSITAQNHGFCVDIKRDARCEMRDAKYHMAGNEDVEVTHINLNDGTCEGMRHRELPIFSVQFHPEASPGPHDTRYLFNEFIEMMK